GQRDDGRDQDGHGQRDGEFAKQAANHLAHEEQRNQHRDQRDGQRNDRETDLLGALERRVQWRFAFFDVTRDVFDHHDGVVDDETGGDGQGHQGQVVDRETGQVHDAESTDQRERDGDARDDGGRDVAQEDEDHHDDEGDREQQFDAHVFDRGADGGGAVGQDLHLDRRRQRRLQLRQELLDAIDGFDDIGAGLALDIEDHRRPLLAADHRPRRQPRIFGAVDDLGDVAQADRCAIAPGHDQLAILGGRFELVVGVQRRGARRAVEAAFRRIDVGAADRRPQILEIEAV